MRRFAFIYFDAPKQWDKLLDEWGPISNEIKPKIIGLASIKGRKFGPAIIKDVVYYISQRGNDENALAEAIVSSVIPQLIGLDDVKLDDVWKDIGSLFDRKDIPNTIIKTVLVELIGRELKDVT